MYDIPKVKLLIKTSRAYDRGLLRGISRYSQEHGPWSFFQQPAFYQDKETTFFNEWQVDGIIGHTHDKKLLSKIMQQHIPSVIQGIIEVVKDQPTIVSDDVKIGEVAAVHFLEKGIKNFAYYGIEDVYWSQLRYQGYNGALAKEGFKPFKFLCSSPQKHKRKLHEEILMVEWLRDLPKPVGIMTCNDDQSLDVVQGCFANQFHIPDDVSIIGVDNDEMICDLSYIPLSSIVLSNEKAGYLAAELLDRMMKGQNVGAEKIVIEPLYIATRCSTDITMTDDNEISKAIRFINNNLQKPITVENVINETFLSRRMAEIRFRRITGQTINTYIKEQKIKLICDLLLNTNLSIAQISEKAGFTTSSYLSEVFRRSKKISPMGYRKKFKIV